MAALALYFGPASFTEQRYEGTERRLEAAGA